MSWARRNPRGKGKATHRTRSESWSQQTGRAGLGLAGRDVAGAGRRYVQLFVFDMASFRKKVLLVSNIAVFPGYSTQDITCRGLDSLVRGIHGSYLVASLCCWNRLNTGMNLPSTPLKYLEWFINGDSYIPHNLKSVKKHQDARPCAGYVHLIYIYIYIYHIYIYIY